MFSIFEGQRYIETMPQQPVSVLQKISEFKLVVIGDGGVGKTSFVKRIVAGEFEKLYISTLGSHVDTIGFYTNYGPIKLNVWDTRGQEKLGGLRESYYIGTNCAIIMFDVTSRTSFKNIPRWYKDLTTICEEIPIVIVGNKVDLNEERKVKAKHITFPRKKNIQYYNASAKSNYQIEKSFIYLLKRLLNAPNLELVEPPVLKPVEIEMREDQIKEIEEDLEKATNAKLPDDLNEEFENTIF